MIHLLERTSIVLLLKPPIQCSATIEILHFGYDTRTQHHLVVVRSRACMKLMSEKGFTKKGAHSRHMAVLLIHHLYHHFLWGNLLNHKVSNDQHQCHGNYTSCYLHHVSSFINLQQRSITPSIGILKNDLLQLLVDEGVVVKEVGNVPTMHAVSL